jgi:hypothetical protein
MITADEKISRAAVALPDRATSPVGTSRQLLRRGVMSGVGGEPDFITDGLDQTLLG